LARKDHDTRPNDVREIIESFSKGMPLADAFECLFENASDAIYILDTHGNFVAVNSKAEELTGVQTRRVHRKIVQKDNSSKKLP